MCIFKHDTSLRLNLSYPLMSVNDCNLNDSSMRSVQTALVETIKCDYDNNFVFAITNKCDVIFFFQPNNIYEH